MKKVEHYICEICGTEYRSKNACVECEKGHCKPVSIGSAKYSCVTSKYPTIIFIKMDDGEVVRHER